MFSLLHSLLLSPLLPACLLFPRTLSFFPCPGVLKMRPLTAALRAGEGPHCVLQGDSGAPRMDLLLVFVCVMAYDY